VKQAPTFENYVPLLIGVGPKTFRLQIRVVIGLSTLPEGRDDGREWIDDGIGG